MELSVHPDLDVLNDQERLRYQLAHASAHYPTTTALFGQRPSKQQKQEMEPSFDRDLSLLTSRILRQLAEDSASGGGRPGFKAIVSLVNVRAAAGVLGLKGGVGGRGGGMCVRTRMWLYECACAWQFLTNRAFPRCIPQELVKRLPKGWLGAELAANLRSLDRNDSARARVLFEISLLLPSTHLFNRDQPASGVLDQCRLFRHGLLLLVGSRPQLGEIRSHVAAGFFSVYGGERHHSVLKACPDLVVGVLVPVEEPVRRLAGVGDLLAFTAAINSTLEGQPPNALLQGADEDLHPGLAESILECLHRHLEHCPAPEQRQRAIQLAASGVALMDRPASRCGLFKHTVTSLRDGILRDAGVQGNGLDTSASLVGLDSWRAALLDELAARSPASTCTFIAPSAKDTEDAHALLYFR